MMHKARFIHWFNRRRELISVCLFCTVVIGIVAWLTPPKQHADPLATYSTYNVTADGYGAWYELLRREGIPVQRFERHIVHLDHSVATLIIAYESGPKPDEPSSRDRNRELDVEHLRTWVRSGGHLVYITGSSQAGFPSNASLHSTEQSVGRGTIITISHDARLLSNALIGNAKHASEALALLHADQSTGSIAFLERFHGHAVNDHWWQIAPAPVAYGLLFAFVTIFLWISGLAWRFGPIVISTKAENFHSSAFVDALASLIRRGHARETLRNTVIRNALSLVGQDFRATTDPDIQTLRANLLHSRSTDYSDTIRRTQRIRKAYLQ